MIRPHLLTTAIGHGSIAAESIDHYLKGEELGKRPKIDVHHFDLMRKLVETELAPKNIIKQQGRDQEGRTLPRKSIWDLRGTDTAKFAVHNFEDRSDKYVIPSDELFLGHFPFTPRNKRNT